ncbi:MAG TPA: hypothetical protein DEP84_07200 [Chloroflexi bacterium]|nr:hypothetical protein [Chloroflexota bacterium]
MHRSRRQPAGSALPRCCRRPLRRWPGSPPASHRRSPVGSRRRDAPARPVRRAPGRQCRRRPARSRCRR